MASRHFNCPSCSKEISIDSETCSNCGAIIEDGATRRFDPRNTPTWIGQATPATITPGTEVLDPGLFFSRFAAQLSAGLFLGFICVFLLLLFVAVFAK